LFSGRQRSAAVFLTMMRDGSVAQWSNPTAMFGPGRKRSEAEVLADGGDLFVHQVGGEGVFEAFVIEALGGLPRLSFAVFDIRVGIDDDPDDAGDVVLAVIRLKGVRRAAFVKGHQALDQPLLQHQRQPHGPRRPAKGPRQAFVDGGFNRAGLLQGLGLILDV
jgi:hypothetical protein